METSVSIVSNAPRCSMSEAVSEESGEVALHKV